MKRSDAGRTLMLVGILMTFGLLPASAGTVVIPNINENTPGPSNQAFPYNQGVMRVQQVFSASQFQGMSGVITQIAFRIDEGTGAPFTSGPIDTEVRLCHTNVQPTAMSLTFASNYGSDVTLVYDGFLLLSSTGVGFDISLDVAPIFVYNGTQNLLVEYKVFGPASTTQFDAAGTSIGEGGTPWVDRLWAGGPNAVTGVSDGDDGYVTRFRIEAPTPVLASSWGRIKTAYRH